MRPLLLIDTSVWIDIVRDASDLRRLRRQGCAISLTDESVLELVAGAAGAAERGDSAAYEGCRAACGQAAAYSTVAMEPIGCHLARLIGLEHGPVLDLRSIVREVAESRTLTAFRSRFKKDALDTWPVYRDAQRTRWRKSITDALAGFGDNGVRIDRKQYGEMKSEPLSEGRRNLLRIEAEEVKIALEHPSRHTDEWIVNALTPHLDVYLEFFREVCLDRFSGPHNDNERRVRFEDNDWNDVAQWRYLQNGAVWVTNEKRWPRLAARTKYPDSIAHPSQVASRDPAP